MKLSLKPIRASRAPEFQGHYGGSQLVLTLYRMHFFCFQMCNRLPEMMKNGDAGIFTVYYSLKLKLRSDLYCSSWEHFLNYPPRNFFFSGRQPIRLNVRTIGLDSFRFFFRNNRRSILYFSKLRVCTCTIQVCCSVD